MKYLYLFVLLVATLFSEESYSEQEWGIAVTLRTSSVPYNSEDSVVNSYIPLLFYEDKYFFLNGLEGGIKLYERERYRFSVLARMRLMEIPEEYQNDISNNMLDYGIQMRYSPDELQRIDMEVMSDEHHCMHANLTYAAVFENGSWKTEPYATLRYKSSDFNTRYYALEQEHIGSGLDGAVGVKAKYHVTSNLYLLASAQNRWLDSNAKSAALVDDSSEYELYAGFGFFNGNSKRKKHARSTSPYVRISHGFSTAASTHEIILGQNEEEEPYNNQMTSLFYGHPLSDELFGLPLDIYLTPGFVWHWKSDVQGSSQEYVIAFKAYYTFALPVKVRFGAAYGLSYVNSITYIEEFKMNRKGYSSSSKLMNYLDFSLDTNLGDLFGRDLERFWLGYGIHHRSGAFESSTMFGRKKGGSNYNTAYLQWHF